GNWWIDDVQVTQTQVPGSCETAAVAGPPPIPDGASVAGSPLLLSKSGEDVELVWDATRCPPEAINVYYGTVGDYAGFTGGYCALPPTGTAALSLPDDAWVLVVASDGVDTDGSWSRDHTGTELSYSGAGTVCPSMTAHDPGGTCELP
ncbi:MAG: hypothetical protein PVI01_17400, partial [Gemmatimonadales bacterium]